jgi:hypothetical protein
MLKALDKKVERKPRTGRGRSLFTEVIGPCFLLILLSTTHGEDHSTAKIPTRISSMPEPLHVYALCQNEWVNGNVNNHAEVELRDGASFGPVIADADVSVNGIGLSFDRKKQAYAGDVGKLEQWQRIPIRIETRDGRSIEGYVGVVFMVEFVKPSPWAAATAAHPLPLRWAYSEGSMHTVELLAWKENVETLSQEVAGNSTTFDIRRVSPNLQAGDVVHFQVVPFRTGDYEFKGNTTKRSKAEFFTTAVVSVKIAGVL